MVLTHRVPQADATPFAEPQTVTLDKNQKATLTWSPNRSGTTFYTPVVAITKKADTTYQVKMDGQTVYGEGAIPPTDPDDLVPVWDPPLWFETELTVTIKNLGTATNIYHAQPIGWEEGQDGA